MITKKIPLLLAPLVLAALAGCARIPLDHDAQTQQDVANVQLAADIRLARDGWPAAQWWQAYGDAQLNRLIEQALVGGPTLAITKSRFSQAQAAWLYDHKDRSGSIDVVADANRQRYSGNGLFPEPIGGNYYNDLSLQVRGSYDFDWWGKHRAEIAAVLGEVYARRADYAQAEQALSAAVAQSYFSLQGDWARSANLQKLIAMQDALQQEKAKRIARGLAVNDEQSAAAIDMAALKKQAALLDAQARREREALRALLGADSAALADLTPQALTGAAHALPAKLGLDLLARRADLQAARWRVESSISRVDANAAAFYPDINLRAAFGLDAVSLGSLFKTASRTLFVGPNVTIPLFDSSRLQAGLAIARAQRNEMVADYNQAVFNAVRDIAQEGVGLQGVEAQIVQQHAGNSATEALLRNAQARFRQGLADRGSVLNAELAVLRQQDVTLQLQNAQLQAEVALTRALGGGYWADPQRTPASPAVAAAAATPSLKN